MASVMRVAASRSSSSSCSPPRSSQRLSWKLTATDGWILWNMLRAVLTYARSGRGAVALRRILSWGLKFDSDVYRMCLSVNWLGITGRQRGGENMQVVLERLHRHVGAGRGRTRLAGALAARSLMALCAASPALAKQAPNPEYAAFKDCPIHVKGVKLCVIATTTSGEFTIGNKTVPINKTITLQGGLTNKSEVLVPAADGNTLSKTSLTVPGGLLGIGGIGGEVTATTELLGPVTLNPSLVAGRKGTAVTLPIRVKLDNPVLGESCYVGSELEPVILHLTSGVTAPPPPNTPIEGSAGTLVLNKGATIVTLEGNTLVDNSFPAPAAEGCGGSLALLINPIVNLQVGLPAKAGHNTAVLSGSVSETASSNVKKAHVAP